jgi:hypothetical protein
MKKIFLFALLSIYLVANAQHYSLNDKSVIRINTQLYQITEIDTIRIDTAFITLKFKSNATESECNQVLALGDFDLKHKFNDANSLYKNNSQIKFDNLINSMLSTGKVDKIGFEYLLPVNREAGTYLTQQSFFNPNDPSFYASNYNEINVGDPNSIYITPDHAWYYTTGSPDVIIGFLDGSFDWSHSEFSTGSDGFQNTFVNVSDPWSNPNDPTSGDGIDNDGNGLIDDYKGWDFYPPFENGDNDVRPPSGYDYWPTAIGSIINAKTNNSCAIAGIAGGFNTPGCRLICAKIGDELYFSTVSAEMGIIYTVLSGAKIVVLAWGGNYSPGLEQTIWEAYHLYNTNIIVQSGIKGTIYPTGALEEVISVAGSYENGWANASPVCPYVDIAAPIMEPGVIPYNPCNASQQAINLYGTYTSTSTVAGVVALLLSVNPCLTNDEVKAILYQTANKIGSYPYQNGRNDYFGYGQVDAKAAIQLALSAQYNGNPGFNLTENMTINGPTKYSGNINIMQNGVLTISSTVQMKTGTSITVFPGGRLIIDGGTITSYCGGVWNGIVVRGNAHLNQYPVSNQGYLTISNGGSIQNAICAVKIGISDCDASDCYGGGLVITNNANFVNNKKCIEFVSYQSLNHSKFYN